MPAGLNRLRATSIGIAAAAWVFLDGVDDVLSLAVVLSAVAVKARLILAACLVSLANC